MKIVIAPDSYKESLTAKQVCQAVETGFKRVFPQAEYDSVPVADGGEGTVQSLVDATQGKIVEVDVTGPLGDKVTAFYGLLGDGSQTAVIEMAAASGLHHVPPELRDPKKTSTFGTGELIKSALDDGAKKLIIGLGGSATNDGGIGMMTALGVNFTDAQGNNIEPRGGCLKDIENIDLKYVDKRLADFKIMVACDVDNPLCGDKGAAAVFGPQKGADEDDIKSLDIGLRHYGSKLLEILNADVAEVPGSGAAGGMGAAFLAFTRATLKPGIQLVLDAVDLSSRVSGADLVITGEGRIDQQTIHGKTPMGVAQVAKKFNIPVIGIAGSLGDNHQVVVQCGIDAVFASTPKAMSLEEAMQDAATNVSNLTENIANLWKLSI